MQARARAHRIVRISGEQLCGLDRRGIERLGVQVATDDFGTGRFSRVRLSQSPIDNIKLDGSFLADLPDHDGADAIVRAVSHLGRSVRTTTPVEGVETEDQLDLVRREGYGQMQGCLVSKPAPASVVLQIIGRCEPLMQAGATERPPLPSADPPVSDLSGNAIWTATSGLH